MTTRHKVEFLIAILIIFALILFLFFFLRGSHDAPFPIEETGTLSSPATVSEVAPVAPEDVPLVTVVSARTVARNFVERFGSYSTDADYANVDDVLPLVTDSLATRLTELVRAAESTSTDAYYGISTRAIIFTVLSETESAMTMRVTTQREESIGSPDYTSVRTQDIELSLVKEDDVWIVDDFFWIES